MSLKLVAPQCLGSGIFIDETPRRYATLKRGAISLAPWLQPGEKKAGLDKETEHL
jgi:hypothetical protein